MLTLVLILGGSGSARAGTCGEEQASCFESCHIDFGMEKERRKLTACAERCAERFEDCRDLQGVSNPRGPREPLPTERRYAPPSDVRPYDGYGDGSQVREESRPVDRRSGGGARELDWEDLPPADRAPERAEDWRAPPRADDPSASESPPSDRGDSRPVDREDSRPPSYPEVSSSPEEPRPAPVEPIVPQVPPDRPQAFPDTSENDDFSWGAGE